MLILLPPSESKTAPAAGEPLDLTSLSLPELTEARDGLADELAAVSARPDALDVLGVGPSLADDVARNRCLRTAPAAPALEVYTGVLYDALDAGSLPPDARRVAEDSVLVVSALWGAVRPTDRIPAYRLSMGAALPGTGKLGTWWKPRLTPLLDALAAHRVVVDCRSAAYAAAWAPPAPRTVTVRVEQRRPDGTRSVVSHHAKHTRGLVARTLCEARAAGAALETVEGVRDAVASRWEVELRQPAGRKAGVLTVVLDPQ
ncbi:peroxide stress protein YaaA [Kocuria rhizophila]|uniref:YaaA family protein n=1 Tax=Kocuria TaxID=57493 RepID=UPI000DD2CE87|nr:MULTISPECIES: peroxide stress protein YaaA [Kocuria]MCC5673086.1 peroxide stress protein YaaA [Kocuria rhizophila]MCC5674894.1 peroxide stress protein YaaA [Kocuria rhizophila]